MQIDVDLSQVTALIIDDSRYARSFIKTALQSFGVRTILEASDGPSGLDILREKTVHLIIVDQDMAPMSGVDFTRYLRGGDMVATVLPPASSATVLVAVQESDQARITPGLTVNVTSGETQTTGTVTAIDAAPEPSEVESARLGVPLTAGTSVFPMTITLAEPLEAGAGATAQIIISQKTLLQQLTGLGS